MTTKKTEYKVLDESAQSNLVQDKLRQLETEHFSAALDLELAQTDDTTDPVMLDAAQRRVTSAQNRLDSLRKKAE